MRTLNEEITEEFLEMLVDNAVSRIEKVIKQLDISIDYVAALLGDEDPLSMQTKQSIYGRMPPGTHHIKKEKA